MAVGEYFPTAKNAMVKDFYKERKFQAVQTDQAKTAFQYDLSSFQLEIPSFFKEVIAASPKAEAKAVSVK